MRLEISPTNISYLSEVENLDYKERARLETSPTESGEKVYSFFGFTVDAGTLRNDSDSYRF